MKEEFLVSVRAALENRSAVFLRRIEWPRDPLSPYLFFEGFASGHDPEDHALFAGDDVAWRWRVECIDIDSFSVGSYDEIDSLEMPREHPFLWNLSSRPRSLHFRGQPRDMDSLIGALARTHEEVSRGLLPLTSLFNCNSLQGLVQLIEGGHGLFARGPSELMRAYAQVLEAHGCQPNLLGDGTEEGHDRFLGYNLLLWNRTSFVIADEFQFVREV
jgi:hypothetical protein